MPKVLPFPESPTKPDPAPVDAGQQSVIDAIKVLLRGLPPEGQERALAEITEAIRPISTPRGGGVLNAIVRILPRRTEWSINDLKREVREQGIEATDKEIYNGVGYLTRHKRIRRVAYGRYLLDGGLLETADDLGLEPTRFDDD
jgi:hypothetical protein